jgi:hypothetical protein
MDRYDQTSPLAARIKGLDVGLFPYGVLPPSALGLASDVSRIDIEDDAARSNGALELESFVPTRKRPLPFDQKSGAVT